MPNTIAQNLARLQAARTAITGAITAKGGTVTAGDGFEEFPADIATIPSGERDIRLDIPPIQIDMRASFTNVWSTKTWSGLTSFNGNNVWTDGSDIYYSSGNDQYVLGKLSAGLPTTKCVPGYIG